MHYASHKSFGNKKQTNDLQFVIITFPQAMGMVLFLGGEANSQVSLLGLFAFGILVNG